MNYTLKEKNEIKKIITNILMIQGKKIKSINIFDDIIFNLKQKNKKYDPYFIIIQSINKTQPLFEIKTIKIIKSTINVPIPLNKKKRIKNGIKLIIETIKDEKNLIDSFSTEILNTFYNKSESILKKETIHKKAFENRSFIHFRWFN